MRRRAIVLLVSAALLVVPAPRADAQVVVAAALNNYVTPATVIVTRDQPATFVNADIGEHDVVALGAYRADGSAPWCFGVPSGKCPLFWTPVINLGETTEILGLPEAEVGVPYTFYCTRHPWMEGILVVGS